MKIRIGTREVEFLDDLLKNPDFKRGVIDCLKEHPPREGTPVYLEGFAAAYKQIMESVPRPRFTGGELRAIIQAVEEVK